MKTKLKVAATVTIHQASRMTTKGRTNIAKWLKRQADLLLNYPTELSKRYTARYLHK